MSSSTTFFITTLIISGFVTLLVILLLHQLELSAPSSQRTRTHPVSDTASSSTWSTRLPGWRPVGHTYDEQILLQNMASVIPNRAAHVQDNIPTVPCLSADSHLLVLSASASRIR